MRLALGPVTYSRTRSARGRSLRQRSGRLQGCSVPKVPTVREDHRRARFADGGDHLVVALRAAGLHDRAHACLERERAGRRRTGRTRRRRARRRRGRDRAPAPSRRDPHRVDPAHLPRADADRHAALREHDRVRGDVLDDRPGEQEIVPRRGSSRSPQTTSIASLGSPSASRSCTSRPPCTRRRSSSVVTKPRRSTSSRMRVARLDDERLERLLVVAGREQHLDELLVRSPRRARPRPVG